MDKTEIQIRRSQEAERLMGHELMVDAKAHIEAELWRLFRETAPNDADTLQFVKAMQYYHDKYFAYLTRAVSDGKVALANAKAKKTLREKFFG